MSMMRLVRLACCVAPFFAVAESAFAQAFPAPYCNLVVDSNVEPITRVQFREIDNVSSADIDGSPALENFLHLTATVAPGEDYDISVSGNSAGAYSNEYSAYVDWNQDGDFDDAGEFYWIGRLVNTTGTDGKETYESIGVPADAVTGTTRLRIVKSYNEVGEACGTVDYGQAEDYSVLVSDGSTPSDTQPVVLLPIPNQSADEGAPFSLSVAEHFEAQDDSDLLFSASGLPAGLRIDEESGLIDGSPTASGSFLVRVQASNVLEEYVEASFVLTVAGEHDDFPAPYCAVEFGVVEPITRVRFGSIDNDGRSGGGGSADLENFIGLRAEVEPGESYTIRVEASTEGRFTNYLRVYFDWNQDGDFDDLEERHEIGSLYDSTGNDGEEVSATVTVPLTALPGVTRMRVHKRYYEDEGGCGELSYGQAEDYTVEVGGEPSEPSDSRPVLLSPLPDQEVGAMQDFLLETAAHFSDPNDATLTFSAGLPPGLSIASDSGRISGRPEALGEHTVAVRATNTSAEFVTAYFTLTVQPEAFAGGDGSPTDPWQVATPGQLFALRADSLAHYALVADIDLGTAPWNQGAGWLPIGEEGASFLGSLDGQGYSIRGLRIDRPDQDEVGLFGDVQSAEFHDLRLEDVYVNGGEKVGGLAGNLFLSTLSGVSVEGRVEGEYAVGGLAGEASNSEIRESHFHGEVTADDSVGGLVALVYETLIDSSHAKVDVSGNTGGGLAGVLGWLSELRDSFAQGSVSGDYYTGGLAGDAYGSQVLRSYAATSLGSGYSVGALLGYMLDAELRDSVWSSALAPGRSAAGYLDSSEGPNVIARSEGLDEDAWQEAATFSDLGWDLSTVWALSPAPGLPYHRWAGAESGAEPHPLPEQFLLLGKPFSLDLAANFSALPGDVVSFSASGLPSGLSVDTATGLLSGSTTQKGRFTVEVQALFSDASEPMLSFGLTVLDFAGGQGSSADPWQIASASQLDELRRHPNGHFLLTVDIALDADQTDSPFHNGGKGWEPIGDAALPFTGSFDGGGRRISGVFIRRNEGPVGLFGQASGAVFRNVTLEVDVEGADEGVGGLVGYLEEGSIANAHVSGRVVASGPAGGIAGTLLYGDLTNSHFSGDVIGDLTAGGLLGEFGQGELRDSYALGEVMGDGIAGGLLGLLNAGGAVADSYANVAVSGLLSGALIGAVTGDSDGVSASFWNSAVVPDLDAAGYDELGLDFAGLAPAALRAEATFGDAGWDLDVLWALHPSVNDGFPYLRSEGLTPDNVAPTFSAFSGPLGSIDEDQTFAGDFALLAALADAEDSHGSDGAGAVVGFVVKALSSGSLEIDGMPFDAASNALISADRPFVWTPAADANGLLAAFTVTALDDEDSESATPVQAQVDVLPVNDAPVLHSPVPDQRVDIGESVELEVDGHFGDVDGDALAFSATGLPAGLDIDAAGRISGSAGTAGEYEVRVRATDPDEEEAFADFTFTVVGVGTPAPSPGPVPGPGSGSGSGSDPQRIDAERQGVDLRGSVIITPEGVLNGGYVQGSIHNEGLITGELRFGAGSSVDGGSIDASLLGAPGQPLRIVNADIGAGSYLENVVIGPGTILHPDVLLGPGVRFESDDLIPPGIDLSASLPGLNWSTGDARPLVDLDGDVLSPDAHSGSVLQALRRLPPILSGDGELVQDPDSGELWYEDGGSRSAALPVLLSQADAGQQSGLYVNEDGDLVFVTDNGRALVSHPLLVDSGFFGQVLATMGMELRFDERATLLVQPAAPAEEGEDTPFYYAARPALSALPASGEWQEGLHVHAPDGLSSLGGLTLVFRDEEGRLLQQELVPVPADWQSLKDVLRELPGVTEARIDMRGVITLVQDGRVLQGRTGFQVLRGGPSAPGLSLQPMGDLNGDGIGDYRIHYPNGDSQELYILPGSDA